MTLSRELEVALGEPFDHGDVWRREPTGDRTPSAGLPDKFGLVHKRVGEFEATRKTDPQSWALTVCALDMGMGDVKGRESSEYLSWACWDELDHVL